MMDLTVARVKKRNFSMTLEDWNTILQFASAVLLGLTFAVGAGAVWTGYVLGRRQEERIKATEKATADANARAAEANEKAEQERLARVQLEAKLAPRSISREQEERVQAEISRLAGQYVTVTFDNNPEAAAFASQIESVLRSAGWVIAGFSPTIPGTGLPIARGVLVMPEPPEQSKAAARVLLSALTKEGIVASLVPMDRKKGVEEDLYLNSPDPIYKRVLVLVGSHP